MPSAEGGALRVKITRDDGLLTRAQAAELCGVGPDTISMWVKRGHLKVAGREHGHPLYNVIDLAKAEHATAARARRVIVPTARATCAA